MPQPIITIEADASAVQAEVKRLASAEIQKAVLEGAAEGVAVEAIAHFRERGQEPRDNSGFPANGQPFPKRHFWKIDTVLTGRESGEIAHSTAVRQHEQGIAGRKERERLQGEAERLAEDRRRLAEEHADAKAVSGDAAKNARHVADARQRAWEKSRGTKQETQNLSLFKEATEAAEAMERSHDQEGREFIAAMRRIEAEQRRNAKEAREIGKMSGL